MRAISDDEAFELATPVDEDVGWERCAMSESLVERGLMTKREYETQNFYVTEYAPTELGMLALRAWRALQEFKPA